MARPKFGHIVTEGWAGISKIPVEVLSETRKKYRVKLLTDCPLPGRNRSGKAGQVILVPKDVFRRTV